MSESEITLSIKPSSGSKFEITIDETALVSELKSKVEEQSEVPAAQQRLIYAGKVLKDHDAVSTYKIKSGQTVHLVKGANVSSGNTAAPAAAATSGSTTSSTTGSIPAPSNLAAGQGANNPLADLTGARYAGMHSLPSASMFGPDGGMSSPDAMLDMLDQPGVGDALRNMMSDPSTVEMIINSNPQLQGMAPQFRQMMQNEQFREMLSNPQALRQMMQMQQMMGGGAGAGAGAGGAGAGGFPAPGDASGNNNNNTESNTTDGDRATTASQPNPFAALLGGMGPGALGGMGGMGGAPPPQDDRPPEVRYESQLAQLNELGFYDFDRNVAALRRAGGNVQGAIEALLDGQV